MAQWLSAFTVLAEEMSLAPSTSMVAQYCQYSSSKRSDILFWPPGPPGMLVMHIHTSRQNTQTHLLNVSHDIVGPWAGLPSGRHVTGIQKPRQCQRMVVVSTSRYCGFAGGL